MGSIRERIAYLQGLAVGLELGQDTKEAKLIGNILEVLGEMAEELIFLSDQQEELNEYLTAIDESLGELEDDYYIEDEFYTDDDYIEVDCSDCGERVYFEREILDEDGVVEITCPSCGMIVFSTEDADEEETYDLVDADDDIV